MAVYTQLANDDIRSFLSRYDLGTLIAFEGIRGGVENTNYFLDIAPHSSVAGAQSARRYVLTIFEYLPESSLPFFIDYTDELKSAGLPVPAVVRDRCGQGIQKLKGKSAVLAPCLPGRHLDRLTADHCQQMGQLLGQIHKTGLDSSLKQRNIRGIHWLDSQQRRLFNLIPAAQAQYMKAQWQQIKTELESQDELPQGLIHGDLFHDNVLFTDNRLTGVIDFYQSCHDYLLYDLAVTVNDWCISPDLELDEVKTVALLQAYGAVRPLTAAEEAAWPLMLRLAAFRFWISRIITFVHPEREPGPLQQQALQDCFLDPAKFQDMLALRNQRCLPLPCSLRC